VRLRLYGPDAEQAAHSLIAQRSGLPGKGRRGRALAPITDRDPITLFEGWLEEALKKEPGDANAMTLATVDETGMPDARMVLLKGVDAAGFTFFTNFESDKGRQLIAHPKAALVFHWKSLRRQVRVRGDIAPVSEAEADAYHGRPRPLVANRRLGSDQSRELPDRLALERRIAETGLKVRPRARAASAALVGLPADSAHHRVLARPPVPPARAPGLRARRRRLDGEEAVSVSPRSSLLPLREKVAAKRSDEGCDAGAGVTPHPALRRHLLRKGRRMKVHDWLAASSERVIETSCAWVFLEAGGR